jgi:hypothetical protein
MRSKTTHWGILTVIGIILLALLTLPSVHRAKARPQRIMTVNSMSTVTLTMTNASALPAIHR